FIVTIAKQHGAIHQSGAGSASCVRTEVPKSAVDRSSGRDRVLGPSEDSTATTHWAYRITNRR
ncbi:hypothetical protein, partial [Roseiconus lacunae]